LVLEEGPALVASPTCCKHLEDEHFLYQLDAAILNPNSAPLSGADAIVENAPQDIDIVVIRAIYFMARALKHFLIIPQIPTLLELIQDIPRTLFECPYKAFKRDNRLVVPAMDRNIV